MAPGPYFIPVMVLKYCKPLLSCMLTDIFKESCFPNSLKVSSVVSVFKNLKGRPMVKNYHLVSLLCVVSKIFEKLVNHRLVHHLTKCDLYGFRSFHSTAYLVTVVSDWIARDFNSFGASHVIALDISKAFHMLLSHSSQTRVLRISVWVFGHISSFLGKKQVLMVLDGKSMLE